MAVRLIRKNNAPCLYKKCREVTSFDAKLAELIDDMFDTMYDAEGVGLAGPQVGILRRVVVIDVGEGPIEMVNPKIIAYAGKQGGMGQLHQYRGEGLFARAVFHELDHLDGIVYLNKVTDPPADFKEEE